MRWNTLNLTFSYDGGHRYYGNAWQAAKNWTDLGTGLTVEPAPDGTHGDIVFDDVYYPGDNYYGDTLLPDAWMDGPYGVPTTSAPSPYVVHILVNQFYMDKLDDFHRTAALTHEMGHALGLAHPDVACGVTSPTIMHSGGASVPQWSFNTPQTYDRIDLEELYNLPIH
jgi:hypothetical protein